MYELDGKRPQPFLEEQRGGVVNVLVVDGEGNVDDSLDRQYLPKVMEDGSVRYAKISEVPLPKLVDAGQQVEQLRRLIDRPTEVLQRPVAGEPRAFPVPIITVDRETREEEVN